MLHLYTMASSPAALRSLVDTDSDLEYSSIYLARPGMRMPVIRKHLNRTSLSMATWGMRTGTHTLLMENVMRLKPYNRWIHTQRCAIPANCYITYKTGDPNPYLVRIPSARVFFMGGLMSPDVDHPAFIILTTQSADVLAPVTEKMPVLFTAETMQTWLAANHLMDIMHIADRSGDYWFDYFPIASEVLNQDINSPELLKPAGPSFREVEDRDKTLKLVDLKNERYDRRGGKW